MVDKRAGNGSPFSCYLLLVTIVAAVEMTPFNSSIVRLLLLIAVCVLILQVLSSGCDNDERKNENDSDVSSCVTCHQIEVDQHHAFSCTTCHGGADTEQEREAAHIELVSQPAHPDNAKKFCSSCHADEVSMVDNNAHYTLNSHLVLVRKSFGLPEHSSIKDLSAVNSPSSLSELVDDLLARRCLRCHVYYEGDDFPLTRRASGCGACHLDYSDGHLSNHRFIKKPGDDRCLSCHYGNHVGFDYHGRFEHDYNEEYRTPYTTSEAFFRPYGVEFHQLTPDVHQRSGMVCIDCHDKDQIMSDKQDSPSCRSCHDPSLVQRSGTSPSKNGALIHSFVSKATGEMLSAPLMTHAVHRKYSGVISCQGCHAQWSFGDEQTHLVRVDHDDFDELEKLTLDGSSEVHQIVASHMDFEAEWLVPEMKDKFTGELVSGLWRKGYGQRRWETVTLTGQLGGQYQVSRPILELFLSWIDEEESLQYDNVSTREEFRQRPYAPHTIGRAGPFYEKRFRHLLESAPSIEEKQ